MTDITPLIERIEKRATEEGVLDLLALSQLKATLQGLESELSIVKEREVSLIARHLDICGDLDETNVKLSAAESRAARAEKRLAEYERAERIALTDGGDQ